MAPDPKHADGIERQLGYIAGKMESIEGSTKQTSKKIDTVHAAVIELNNTTMKKESCAKRHERISHEFQHLKKAVEDTCDRLATEVEEVSGVYQIDEVNQSFNIWEWAKPRLTVILGVIALLTVFATAYRTYLRMDDLTKSQQQETKKEKQLKETLLKQTEELHKIIKTLPKKEGHHE